MTCCDLTGDAVLDLVAAASLADIGGTPDAGAIYLWRGGATLSGALAPTTALAAPGASAGDQLGGRDGILP